MNVTTLVLGILLVLSLGWGLLCKLDEWDQRGVARFLGAEASYLEQLATASCARRAAFIATARARGWTVEEQPEHVWGEKAATAHSALRVHVEPPLPFSKEPGVLYFFDRQGCLI